MEVGQGACTVTLVRLCLSRATLHQRFEMLCSLSNAKLKREKLVPISKLGAAGGREGSLTLYLQPDGQPRPLHPL